MSSVMTSVQWLFGDIVNYFKFMDLKKILKIGLIDLLEILCSSNYFAKFTNNSGWEHNFKLFRNNLQIFTSIFTYLIKIYLKKKTF